MVGDHDGTTDGGGGGGCGENLQHRSSCLYSSIREVSLTDIELGAVVGYGRNGCVIQANWEGKQIALKQFDCER